jgi:NADH dehydrogenase (ubiquinone) Fe-S protein 1
MARCSAAKETNVADTNFMAPGEPHPQVGYGPPAQAAFG